MIAAAVTGSAEHASGICPSPAKQARGWVEAYPAASGQVDFRPGVQIGEILVGTARAVERFDVGRELDQVAGNESCGEAQMPEQLHQKPGAIAARTAAERQRFFRALNPRLHADRIFDSLLDSLIYVHQKIVGANLFLARFRDQGLHQRPRVGASSSREIALFGRPGRIETEISSAYFSRKKSKGLMTVMSATRSTSTENSVVLLGKTSRAR